MLAYPPPSFAPHHGDWHFEQAAWAVPTYYFLYDAAGASYLLAFFAVQEMFRWVKCEVCPRCLWIKPFLLLLFILFLVWTCRSLRPGRVGTWTSDVSIGETHGPSTTISLSGFLRTLIMVFDIQLNDSCPQLNLVKVAFRRNVGKSRG